MKGRWFSSVIQAANGPLAAPRRGYELCFLRHHSRGEIPLKDAVEELGAELIGEEF